MWGVAVRGYLVLPARFPAHFGADGVADRYVDRSLVGWFALPLVFTVIGGLLAAIGLFVDRLAKNHAEFVNVPDRLAFLRLPADARMKALAPITDVGLMMPPALASLSAYVQWASVEVALGRQRTLSTFPIVLVLIWSFGTVATGLVRTQRAIRALSA